jgi:class 3 adenylate cyclase
VERLPAAVVFADISGFTPLAERLARRGPAGAEELSTLLNAYFAKLTTLIAGHGGEVITFAGDDCWRCGRQPMTMPTWPRRPAMPGGAPWPSSRHWAATRRLTV